MRAVRFLRSTAFRLTLLYVGLFGASVMMLLLFIYWSTAQSISRQIDETLTVEIDALAQHYRSKGLKGLVNAIEKRTGPQNIGGGLYLLTTPNLDHIAGNVAEWPREAGEFGRWLIFPVRGMEAGERVFGRAQAFRLPGGYNLLVGRDMRALERFKNLMMEAMVWALLGTVVLGLGGGVLISRRVLGRIDGINRGAETIMRGDLGHRMDKDGSGDEFDRLVDTLNAMLDQIERLMTGIRTVTNDIAHDLRSPLTRMRSQLEQAVASARSTDEMRELCVQVMAETDSLLATFNALLSIAEAEAGVLPASATEVDLGQLVEDVADLYGPLAEDKGLGMDHVAEPGLRVLGSRELLFQALSNLVDNAVKYTPAPGRVLIEALQSERGVLLSVSDSGPGIPPSERDRVLERFVRLDASRTTPGNGLGLSLVAAIARMHRAALELADASDVQPKGLRITLVLPKPAEGGGKEQGAT